MGGGNHDIEYIKQFKQRLDGRKLTESRKLFHKKENNLHFFCSSDKKIFFIFSVEIIENNNNNKNNNKTNNSSVVVTTTAPPIITSLHTTTLLNSLNFLKYVYKSRIVGKKITIELKDVNISSNSNNQLRSECTEHYHNAFIKVCEVENIPLKSNLKKKYFTGNDEIILRDPIDSLDWNMELFTTNNKNLKNNININSTQSSSNLDNNKNNSNLNNNSNLDINKNININLKNNSNLFSSVEKIGKGDSFLELFL